MSRYLTVVCGDGSLKAEFFWYLHFCDVVVSGGRQGRGEGVVGSGMEIDLVFLF